MDDSPAAKAGLERGDAILTVDGDKVKNSQDFVSKIRNRFAGEKVSLGVVRNRKNITVDILLGEMPGNEGVITSGTDGAKMLRGLGIEVAPVTAEIQKKNKLRNSDGLVVTSVENGSVAQRSGLREGDILLEVNGTRLGAPKDLEKMAPGKGNSTVLLVWRNGRTFFVSIRGGTEK